MNLTPLGPSIPQVSVPRSKKPSRPTASVSRGPEQGTQVRQVPRGKFVFSTNSYPFRGFEGLKAFQGQTGGIIPGKPLRKLVLPLNPSSMKGNKRLRVIQPESDSEDSCGDMAQSRLSVSSSNTPIGLETLDTLVQDTSLHAYGFTHLFKTIQDLPSNLTKPLMEDAIIEGEREEVQLLC